MSERPYEQGTLLILSMIVIFAMSAIGLSLARTVLSQYTTQKQRVYVENAVTAAEAGVTATVQQLQKTAAFGGYADSDRQQLYDDAARGRADYSTVVTSNPDETKTITSTGYAYRPGETLPYNTKRIKVTVKAEMTSVPAGVAVGGGGLILTNGRVMAKNVYVNGQVSVGTSTSIGAGGFMFTPYDTNLHVSNVACGSGASFPQPCSNQPINIGWNGGIYGTVCATNQTSNAGINSGISGQGLVPNCTAPQVTMPAYDRSGMYDAMLAANGTRTSASVGSCSLFVHNLTLAKDQIYTGNMGISGSSCRATVKGDTYITGNLNVSFFANLRVDDALTTPPIILVDGTVNFNNAGIQANSSGVGAIVISFKSNNPSCDHSCNSLSAADLYNSINTTTTTCNGGFCQMPGSTLYSYFGTALVTGSGSLSGMGGQRVWVDSLSSIISDAIDRNGLSNDDAFSGGVKLSNWKKVDYQQLY